MSVPTETRGADAAPRAVPNPRRRVIALVLLGALAGGLLGWALQVPLYRCEGVLRIEPSSQRPRDPEACGGLPMFGAFVAAQAELLQTRRATLRALETEVWKKTGEPSGVDAISRFEERRCVVHDPGTQILRVQFLATRPETAQAGVRALLEAYESFRTEHDDSEELLQSVQTARGRLEERIEEIQETILELTVDYGGIEVLEVRHAAVVEQLREAESEAAEGLEELRALSRKLAETRAEVERLQAERSELVRKLASMSSVIDQLESRLVEAAVIKIDDRGALPTEPFQRSPPWAPAWGGAEGALVGLILALLLRRRR